MMKSDEKRASEREEKEKKRTEEGWKCISSLADLRTRGRKNERKQKKKDEREKTDEGCKRIH